MPLGASIKTKSTPSVGVTIEKKASIDVVKHSSYRVSISHAIASAMFFIWLSDTPKTAPRVVFDNALTEEGFLGLARDLDLLALPFASHADLMSLFRRHCGRMTQG